MSRQNNYSQGLPIVLPCLSEHDNRQLKNAVQRLASNTLAIICYTLFNDSKLSCAIKSKHYQNKNSKNGTTVNFNNKINIKYNMYQSIKVQTVGNTNLELKPNVFFIW